MRTTKPRRPAGDPKPLTPDDRLRFGRHRGEELWAVIREDPAYVAWCIENVEGFELDNEAWALYQAARGR